MITDSQYLDWLKDDSAIFTFLVEAMAMVGGVETTIYISTVAYSTGPTDIPPNVTYDPSATLDVLFTEQLTLDNSDSSISAGQVSIDNFDGSRDGWFNYVWANRSIKVYVGDVRWARGDFRMVFNGVVADIAPNGRQGIYLKLRDRLQQINTPVSDVLLGGTGQYKDELVPVSFGELHNVTPLLENGVTLAYRVHTGPIEGVPEVRDNGVPLTGTSQPTIDVSTGRITLVASPAGSITATVQGDKNVTYRNTCAALVQRIVTGYGDASKRLSVSDIDTTVFSVFDSTHQQPMGVGCDSKTNILDLCRQLTGSIGAQIYFTSQGLLRIIQLTPTPQGTPVVVTANDMDVKSLGPSQRTDVVAAIKLGFCKNWTVQANLTSGISVAHKDMYAQEWLVSNKIDVTTQANYKMSGEPNQQDTMLLTRVDADAEAQRQLDLWKVPRMVYEFEGLPHLMTVEIGQAITVYHSRYNMSGGVTGTIISVSRNWKNRRVKIGFIV